MIHTKINIKSLLCGPPCIVAKLFIMCLRKHLKKYYKSRLVQTDSLKALQGENDYDNNGHAWTVASV